MTDTLALIFGYAMMTLFAVAITAISIYYLAEFIVHFVFKRMLRLYHLSSISYWLHHYEKRGRKCFLTPDEGKSND